MLLEIIHDTKYAYDPNVEIAQHLTHLKPTNLLTQEVLQSTITVDPTPAWQEESTDNYGNIRTFFSLQSRHSELLVSVKSLVNTKSKDISGPFPENTPTWEDVREYFRYHSNTQWNSASEFLFISPFITNHQNFVDFARISFKPNRPILEATIDLMNRIYTEFNYVSKSTDINTPALEALQNRAGVCQDFAHIMICCLRSLGLPAKYISG